MVKIILKRAYEPQAPEDGFRVYVDRLWPRGLSHANFHYDLWAKEVAPSTDLRRWLHEDPSGHWPEFEKKYAQELDTNPAVKEFWEEIAKHGTVTFLYSSHDSAHNNADVLKRYIDSHFNR